ncbi:MAG: hypothetical protein U0165_20105 [Polyangiaceae bacterium]
MDDVERKSFQCVSCRIWSPETDESNTLISSRYGWRLIRTTDASGAFKIEWRCPNCWAKYKKVKASTATPIDGVPALRGFGAEAWPSATVIHQDEPPSSKRADIEPLPPSSTSSPSSSTASSGGSTPTPPPRRKP